MCTHEYNRRILLHLARCEEERGNYALARFYRFRAAAYACAAQEAASNR